jgi:hypothetical protein
VVKTFAMPSLNLNALTAMKPLNCESRASAPAPLTLGSGAIRQGNFRGWGTKNEDMRIKKYFRTREKFAFQLRADFLNALNRSTMSNPYTTLTSPNFGYITGAPFGNRTMQVGTRLDF